MLTCPRKSKSVVHFSFSLFSQNNEEMQTKVRCIRSVRRNVLFTMKTEILLLLLSYNNLYVSGSHIRRRAAGFFDVTPPKPPPVPSCGKGQIDKLSSACDCRWKNQNVEWKNENEYIECLLKVIKFSPCELQAVLDASSCLPFPSSHPTTFPSSHPTISIMPTNPFPSASPTTSSAPTSTPPTFSPSKSTFPTDFPTSGPTKTPTEMPSSAPTTSAFREVKQQKLDKFFALWPSVSSNEPNLPISTESLKELVVVGNDGLPIEGFPLSACQGDCDSDDQCIGDLQCRERDNFELVPGCIGPGEKGKDYCTDPFPSQPWSGDDPNYKFRIRLYWQEDYFWQETYDESWWCMECARCDGFTLGNGDEGNCESPGDTTMSCQDGHNIWIRRCKRANSDYEFNIIKNEGSGDQIRVDGTNLCFSTVDNQYLELRPCNNMDSKQLWKNIDDLSQFELRPYDQRELLPKDSVCLTQMHHPKSREMVGLQPCTRALGHETLYWEEFHRF
jgi:hypothetical protein